MHRLISSFAPNLDDWKSSHLARFRAMKSDLALKQERDNEREQNEGLDQSQTENHRGLNA